MDDVHPIAIRLNAVVGRTLAGVFAGFVLGCLAQAVLFSKTSSSDEARFPLLGALVGSLLIGAITAIAGARQLPRWLKYIATGILTGLVVGVLCGKFAYPPFATSHELNKGPVIVSKSLGPNEIMGMKFGALVGAAAGFSTGLALLCLQKRLS